MKKLSCQNTSQNSNFDFGSRNRYKIYMDKRFRGLKPVLGVIFDCLSIYCAYILSFWVRTNVQLPFTESLLPESRFHAIAHYYSVLFVSHIIMFYFFGIYARRWKKYYWDTTRYLVLPCVFATLVLIAVYFFRKNIYFPRSIFVLLPLFTVLFTNLWRYLSVRVVKGRKSRTIIAGINPDSISLIKAFREHYGDSIEVVGIIAFPGDDVRSLELEGSVSEVPVLGYISEARKRLKHIEFDEIILTPRDSPGDLYIEELSRVRRKQVSLFIVPGIYEILLGRLRHTVVHDIPMVSIRNPSTIELRAIKRGLDLTVAGSLLIFTLPLSILAAIAIKITSPGSIFFRQERMGRGGKGFVIYKFRSMVQDAEKDGARLATDNDKRITLVGRVMRGARVDELPQLLNILMGNMSFVGPRPERKEFVREFINSIPGYRERFRVKPGITGLAQIRGEYHTNARIKLRYDLAYIANYSVWLDIKILFETVRVILTRKGA